MKISIVIPYHNTDRTLFTMCMQSIYSQTFQDYEIIIINDGSSDEFVPILKEYEGDDKRIRVINQKCKGASNARNHGVSVSKGEYISFIDSDDMVVSTYLEDALKVIEQNNGDMVIGGVSFIYKIEAMIPLSKGNTEEVGDDLINVIQTKSEMSKLKNQLASSNRLIRYTNGNINRGPVARLIKKILH